MFRLIKYFLICAVFSSMTASCHALKEMAEVRLLEQISSTVLSVPLGTLPGNTRFFSFYKDGEAAYVHTVFGDFEIRKFGENGIALYPKERETYAEEEL